MRVPRSRAIAAISSAERSSEYRSTGTATAGSLSWARRCMVRRGPWLTCARRSATSSLRLGLVCLSRVASISSTSSASAALSGTGWRNSFARSQTTGSSIPRSTSSGIASLVESSLANKCMREALRRSIGGKLATYMMAPDPHRHGFQSITGICGIRCESGPAVSPAAQRSPRDQLRRCVALQVEERGEVAVVDHGVGGGSDRGLGAERHADAGLAEHREIVCPVADRHGGLTAKAETVAQRDKGLALRLASEDRLLDPAGEPLVCDDEPVRAVLVEADHPGDRAGEEREAARDQAGVRAVRPHRAHEGASAGRQRDARGDDLVDDRERQPL